jgi:hypothetical protein
LIFFSAVNKTLLDRSADRRLTHLNSASCKEELTPVFVGSPRTSLDVFLKQPHGALIQLGPGARRLLGDKRTLFVELRGNA